MRVLQTLVRLALSLIITTSGLSQGTPTWWARPEPLPLPEPSGTVRRVGSAMEFLSAGEAMTPGTTLMVEPGVYRLSRPLVLRQKQNVTIRSATGDPRSVTLQGVGWERGDEHDDILRVADCNGVRITGLTFAECRSYGIKVEAEHGPKNVQIENCHFRNIGIRAIKGSAGRDPAVRASLGSVRFCDFANTKIPSPDWLFGGDYIAGIDMMALEDWTFSDNIFRDIRGRNGGARAAIFIWVRSRRIVIERNLIVNCDRGISLGNPGLSTANQPGAATRYVSEALIQNNWIAGGADCSIELWHVDRVQIRHNSIWRPERNWGRGIRVGTGVADAEVVNNLIHGGIQMEGGQANLHDNVARRIEDYFVAPAAGDLALTAAATAAVNQGVVFNDVPYDIRGRPRDRQPDLGAWEAGARDRGAWIEPMRKVHSRFRGEPGSFAQLGDSITFSAAFWTPLAGSPKNMNATAHAKHRLIKGRLKPEAFRQKGPEFGNQGSMKIQWARENVAHWLVRLNPEVVVILFGSNDVAQQVAIDQYEQATRDVVSACLTNGTVVLLTTAPPQSGRLSKCQEFATAVRRIAADLQVPLVDYAHEILARRHFDWDGAAAEFKSAAGGVYDVLTLISKDGVHPSNPGTFQNDFSGEALANNGYVLRNYLTMTAYAEVIREVLDAKPEP